MIIPIPAGTLLEDLIKTIPDEGRDIHAGYAVLDYLQPDWMEKIELTDLDLGGCESCVIGQVFGDYLAVRSDDPFFSLLTQGQMAYLGFTLPFGSTIPENDFAALTIEHEVALTERIRRAVLSRP